MYSYSYIIKQLIMHHSTWYKRKGDAKNHVVGIDVENAIKQLISVVFQWN